ncbi:methyltransferase [Pseudomonas faucium]|uniref:methyltransferase n=1 Tax=Pseudomonas faucium TaxID=2740518 RepID=UPI001F326AFE|nr:methyltransferase [Pseudomonas faucium]
MSVLSRFGESAPCEMQLVSFYLSRDRVLAFLRGQRLPSEMVMALRGHDVWMASAILSNELGAYVLQAIATGAIKSLDQLERDGQLIEGVPFIHYGPVLGKGFSWANKTPALSLTGKLDYVLQGKKLVIDFSKSGLINDTAFSRMQGLTKLFIFGYVTRINGSSIHAVPFVIGDLIATAPSFPVPIISTLELAPQDIRQFASIDGSWIPSAAEARKLKHVPEQTIKELICNLLEESEVPADWGGEESDVLSGNLIVRGQRQLGAFLLKGPARFHEMKPSDLGKNADQLYRLFNIPAQVYVIQHCHKIGAAVRKQAIALAFMQNLTVPCRVCFIDGVTTIQLLHANRMWPPLGLTPAHCHGRG